MKTTGKAKSGERTDHTEYNEFLATLPLDRQKAHTLLLATFLALLLERNGQHLDAALIDREVAGNVGNG